MRDTVENDPVRIQHMLNAAEQMQRHLAGRTRAHLDQDEVLALAMVRLIEIIGEAASHVTPTTRAGYPEVPWSQIVGMRNRVIHRGNTLHASKKNAAQVSCWKLWLYYPSLLPRGSRHGGGCNSALASRQAYIL